MDKFDFESYQECESYLLGKMTKAPFTGKGQRATERLELIHSDVCGPMRVMARGGYYYFITFTDDFSRYGYVYLMKNKSDSFEKFKKCHTNIFVNENLVKNEAAFSQAFSIFKQIQIFFLFIRIIRIIKNLIVLLKQKRKPF